MPGRGASAIGNFARHPDAGEGRFQDTDSLEQALAEPRPTAEDINRFTYAPSPVDAVYPDDYTGLPS